MKDEEFEKMSKEYLLDEYPKTSEELVKRIDEIVNTSHDYSSSAEAITKVMILASNYVYNKLGNTGFQASWADIQHVYLRLRRHANLGVMVFNANDLIYPQYDNKFEEWRDETLRRPETKEYVKQRIEEANKRGGAHPNVMRKWYEILNYK